MDIAENLGKSLSGVQRTAQGKDFELILILTVETRLGDHLAVSVRNL